MSDALTLENLTLKRGGQIVCRDVSLTVPQGEITVLLGTNGAGKSTLLDGIAGVIPAASGEMFLGDHRLVGMPMYRRVHHGLAYVEQGRSVFSKLTVAQNLALVDRSTAVIGRAFELFPRLAQRRNVRAALLSGGEQQMLSIARALATKPRVLLIDELSQGLAPILARELMQTLSQLAASGLSVVLVEQFAEMALAVGTTAHVMRHGRIVRSGLCLDFIADRDALASAYSLGDTR